MSVSRRTLLRTGLAGAALSAIPFPLWLERQASASGAVPIRYNANSAKGKAQLRTYAQGVALMKKLPDSDPRSWTWQWYTHWIGDPSDLSAKQSVIDKILPNSSDPRRGLAADMWDTCQSHGAANDSIYHFLPWHRMYVYFLEAIIRDLTGKADFTLPYWNYLDTKTQAIPQEFRRPNDPLFSALYRENRNSGINGGTPLPAADMTDECLGKSSFYDVNNVGMSGFSNSLNDGLHGNVHVDVGDTTNMGVVPWAARDPIFWMHHCNVDRIWTSWNKGGGQNPTTDDWTKRQYVFADGKGQRVVCTTADFSSSDGLYRYDSLQPTHFTPAAAKTTVMGAGHGAEHHPMFLSATTAATELLSRSRTQVALPSLHQGHGLTAMAGQRTYLVLSGRSNTSAPGVIYDVYLHAQDQSPTAKDRVGSLNFFCVLTSGSHDGRHSDYSFDVTGKIPAASAVAVSIAPRGTPVESAKPMIAKIGLVTVP